MEFFNSIKQVKANWQPYKKWEAEQDNKEFQRQDLHKKVQTSKEDLERASQYGRTLIESINIMDQYATDKAQDVEMSSKFAMEGVLLVLSVLGGGIGLMASKKPSVKNYLEKLMPNNKAFQKQVVSVVPTIALPMLFFPFVIAKFASYEKEAARTARYQAREDKLKDPKNFVIYDKEQLNKAKEIAKTLPDSIEKKKSELNPIANYNDSIKSVKTIIKDHKNYIKWKEDHLNKEKVKIDNFDNLEVSPEKLKEAKIDQDNLLRTIKKIEVNSQNYLSNTEMACNMVLAFDLILGPALGGIISGITKLLQNFKVVSDTSKIANMVKASSKIASPLLLILATAAYSTKVQKDAARIGRFKAKQDLLKDPHNFITYSNEQLDSVKDLKAPTKAQKAFFGKFKDDMKFFFQLKKDYKEYQQYTKTKYKEEQKIQEALMKIDVSDEQTKNAKSFQKNAFMAFEKIDEMSQRYVTDVEAATDMGKETIISTSNIVGQLAAAYLMLKPSSSQKKLTDIVKSAYPLLLPVLVKIPIDIKSTQIQKEANKIGIMNAMQDLEDPRYFVQDKE